MNSLKRAAREITLHWLREGSKANRKQEIFLEAMHHQILKSVEIILEDEQLQDALVNVILAAHRDFVKHGSSGRRGEGIDNQTETDRTWHCCYIALRLLSQCTFTHTTGYEFSFSMAQRHHRLVYPKWNSVLVDLAENQTRDELLASEALGFMNSIERAEAEAGFRISYERMLFETQQAHAAELLNFIDQVLPGTVRSKCRVLSG